MDPQHLSKERTTEQKAALLGSAQTSEVHGFWFSHDTKLMYSNLQKISGLLSEEARKGGQLSLKSCNDLDYCESLSLPAVFLCVSL
ncbi:hypothetical protein AV530_008702 [Patagioenas fasciata monilis]|uniref:Uncharacterized protein n=1 Tax=Patagioenas fasciata monilis TaxID=372326 RepID=A0A1V4L104_PATFA|nr:hypothetical protein AV530_008702 [Patagioenas fasciata monilis]